MTQHEREIRADRATWMRAAILAAVVLSGVIMATGAEIAWTDYISARIAAGR